MDRDDRLSEGFRLGRALQLAGNNRETLNLRVLRQTTELSCAGVKVRRSARIQKVDSPKFGMERT